MKRLTFTVMQLIVCSVVMTRVTPVSAVDFPDAVLAGRPGMGESKFDANQTEKYTVNVTSGNLYVKQPAFTIPASRGPSIEVSMTYNSMGFVDTHLLGKGNWSFSLSKSLDVQTFYRCDNVGDMEDIEEGDFLEEEPEYNEPDCCDESWPPPCCEEDWPPSCCDESDDGESWPPECCDSADTLNAYCDCCDCYEACEEICGEQSDWDGCFDYCVEDECGECADTDIEDFCANGASECGEDCDCVLYDDNWDCSWCTDWSCWCGDEEDDEGNLLCDICDWACACGDDAVEDVDENETLLCDDACDWSGACGDNHDEVCNFSVGQYDDFDGYLLNNGDGDAVMIYSWSMLADENPYHLEVVDTGSEPYRIKFKDGTVHTFSRGPGGNIISMADRYGNTVSFQYDSEGRPDLVTDAVGRQVQINYNGAGYIDTIVALPNTEKQRTMSFNYTDGYLDEVTDFAGKTTSYEYYPSSSVDNRLLKRITDAEGHSIYFEYEGEGLRGQCTRVYKDEDDDGRKIGDTRYYYDGKNNVTTIDSAAYIGPYPITCQIVKHYDESTNDDYYALKRITQIEEPPGDGITSYEYDEMFHLKKTTDTNGLVHEMAYDDKGNMLTKTADPRGLNYPNGLNYTMYWSYEPYFNQITSFTDANGHTKRYYYVGDGQGGGSGHGPNGVLWKEVDAEGNAIEHWYNEYGQRWKTVDANGNVTEYEYDSDQWDYLTRVRKYGPETDYNTEGYFDATYTYDRWGNKTAETDFNGKPTDYEYDQMNRLKKKTVHDPGQEGEPFVTDYTYYANGNKYEVIDPRRNKTTYYYDAGDRLTDVVEPVNDYTTENRHTHYDYDTRGNKIAEEDPNGNATTFWYDAMNRLIQKNEPLEKITMYFYDGEGDSSTDGGSPEYTRKKDRYTVMAQWRETEDRKGSGWICTYYEYDRLYRLEMVTDDHGGETEYDYDPVGNKIWEEDAEERETKFEYYKNNLLWQITDPMTPAGTMAWSYDGMGNKAWEKDKNNRYTYYDYTDRNLLTKIRYPKPNPTGPDIYVEYTYDGMNKREERDKNGNVTEFFYNARNLVTETKWPTNVSTYYEYDENGNKTLETDPNGNSIHYEYDALNRLHVKTDAYESELDGLTTTYRYDNVGNRVEITDGEGRTTVYDYDALNRLHLVADAKGGHTEYGYDRLGNKIWVKDAEGYKKGYKTDYYYDTLNRLKKVVNPLLKETRYDYDKVGNRTDQWDAEGQHIHYEYDELNRLEWRTFDGAGVTVTYQYDPVGNRRFMYDSRADMDDVEYKYDTLNRLTDVIYSESDKAIHYEYDGNGNRTLMVDAEEGETVYHYDGMNRLDDLVDPDEATTDYGYDAGNRLTDIWYPNGTWTHYTYDEANRITGIVTKNSAQQTIQSISYLDDEDNPAYDRVGNKKRMVDSSGVTTYDYDELYRLKYVTYPDDTTEEYLYDDVGNRKDKKVDGVLAEHCEYNYANQLITRQTAGTGGATKEITVTGTVSDPSYPPYSGVASVAVNDVEAEIAGGSFTAEGVEIQEGENTISAVARDKAGNTTTDTITVTYDPDHAWTSNDYIYTYAYDYNGNLEKMTKTVQGRPDEVTRYEYDFENRLTKVILPNSTTNEFVYDGDKRRVSSKNAAGTTTRFLYDGVNNLGDYDGDWEPIASYTEGVGIDKLIRRKDANGVRYYHADALGTTRLMTRPDQSTAAAYTYDAWGKIILQNGEGSNRHKFTGREWDAEISLQYNRARFYDPEIGRFITQDPLTKGPDDPTVMYYSGVYSVIHRYLKEYIDALQPDKTNRYVYCYNNPINLIDPLGLEPEDREIDKLSDKERAEIFGDDEDKNTGGTRAERDMERIKDQIDRSDLSDKEKQGLKDRIDNMSVPDFNDFRRDWDRIGEKAEGRLDRKMAQQERWTGYDIGRSIVGAGAGLVGMVAAGGAEAIPGLQVPATTFGLYSAYALGANIGNIANVFRGVPSAPTGPAESIAVIAAYGNDTTRLAAKASDLAIPLISGGVTSMGLSRASYEGVSLLYRGLPMDSIKMYPGDPASYIPWAQTALYGDAGIALWDSAREMYDAVNKK